MTYFSIGDDLWAERHWQVNQPTQFQPRRCGDCQCVRQAASVQKQLENLQERQLSGDYESDSGCPAEINRY